MRGEKLVSIKQEIRSGGEIIEIYTPICYKRVFASIYLIFIPTDRICIFRSPTIELVWVKEARIVNLTSIVQIIKKLNFAK